MGKTSMTSIPSDLFDVMDMTTLKFIHYDLLRKPDRQHYGVFGIKYLSKELLKEVEQEIAYRKIMK